MIKKDIVIIFYTSVKKDLKKDLINMRRSDKLIWKPRLKGLDQFRNSRDRNL